MEQKAAVYSVTIPTASSSVPALALVLVLVNRTALSLLLVFSIACARSLPSSVPADAGITTPSGLPTAATTVDLVYCVSETNRYRATVGAPALVRSAALEAYAAEGARIDGTAHDAHSHFKSTNGGGVAFAENELPWWPLGQFRAVQEVMRQGIAQMWAEGPGGAHYENIRGPYAQIGCGVFIQNGEITVVQDFR